MEDEKNREYVNGILLQCLLPELINEIGQSCLESKDFNAFRNSLEVHLVQLFDLIQKNEFLILESTSEIRCNFILLLCEQTASRTFFQTKRPNLLKHLHILSEKYLNKLADEDSTLEPNIFNIYKEKLKPDKWKKQLGATHSFVQFLKLRYEVADRELPSDVYTFVLSVGLLLNEFYEPVYKELSFQIFSTLLRRANRTVIRDLNLHNVVYNAVFGDFSKIDNAAGTKYLCECLFECVKLEEQLEFSKWNRVDELIEAVVRRITFAPDSSVIAVLFVFISKLCVHFSANRDEVIPYLEDSSLRLFVENINKVRGSCLKITSYASYRWAKKLLSLFVAESNYLMGCCRTSSLLLWVMHICYLVCILPISMNILHPHLGEFWNKFMPLLMEVLRINKEEREVEKAVFEFMESFLYHIKCYELKDKEILRYQIAMQKFLDRNISV